MVTLSIGPAQRASSANSVRKNLYSISRQGLRSGRCALGLWSPRWRRAKRHPPCRKDSLISSSKWR